MHSLLVPRAAPAYLPAPCIRHTCAALGVLHLLRTGGVVRVDPGLAHLTSAAPTGNVLLPSWWFKSCKGWRLWWGVDGFPKWGPRTTRGPTAEHRLVIATSPGGFHPIPGFSPPPRTTGEMLHSVILFTEQQAATQSVLRLQHSSSEWLINCFKSAYY